MLLVRDIRRLIYEGHDNHIGDFMYDHVEISGISKKLGGV